MPPLWPRSSQRTLSWWNRKGCLINGRQAIEKALADLFQRWRPANFISEANKLNAIGNGACAVGQWWCTLESQNGPVPVRGYWSEIYFREGVKRWLGRECDSHLLNFHLSTLNSGGNLSSVVNVTATSSKFRSIIEWRSQHQELKKKGPLRLIFFHSQTCARRRASAHMFWGLRSSRTPPTLSTPGRV